MAEIKTMTLTIARNVQLAPYENMRVDYGEQVELAPGDDIEQVRAELELRVMAEVVKLLTMAKGK